MLEGPGKLARSNKTPWTFCLDDGSGETIDVVCWRDDEAAHLATYPGELIKLAFADMHRRPGRTTTGKEVHLDDVELGSIVKVKGWVDEFRGRRQILLERVQVLADTAEEVRAWAELAEFQRDVLAKPWVLTVEEVRRLRDKDDRRRRRVPGCEKRKRDAADVGEGRTDARHASDAGHRTRVVPDKASRDDAKPPGTEERSREGTHRTRIVPRPAVNASKDSVIEDRSRPQANTKAARVRDSR